MCVLDDIWIMHGETADSLSDTTMCVRLCLVSPVKVYRPSYLIFRHMYIVLNIDYL